MLCSSADDSRNSAAVNAVTTSPIYQEIEEKLGDEEKKASTRTLVYLVPRRAVT